MPDAASFLPLAHQLADTARAQSMRYFRTALDVMTKGDSSPVTIADRAAEAAMRALLVQHFPAHGILGEEHGRERLQAEYVWVLDPIDGTKSFITGSPLWGSLIALLHHGQPVLGVMDMPVLNERWTAAAGQPVQRNGESVRTRRCTQLQAACIYTTSPDAFSTAEWAVFDTLSRACMLRRFGGDCYAYAQLAGGLVDLVVEAQLQPYDYLALVPLVTGAGGVVTDWQGNPLGIESDGRVIAAATPQLHAQALALLGASAPQSASRG